MAGFLSRQGMGGAWTARSTITRTIRASRRAVVIRAERKKIKLRRPRSISCLGIALSEFNEEDFLSASFRSLNNRTLEGNDV